ncbi:hypothetical protein DFH08DRAFT_867058 [Mycena albidolilacea]|uniref:SnoaL-like domain-containing protein n=1 Tax=Mycena albidolilacea TaxID=1033008 RepID=A0AAD7A200_9AGAR|nr:hypothetical protein DFH08DRAFT_867058 [Mycena albidolilacea]
MSDLAAKQLENAHAFLTYLNALNWDRLGELLAPDFRHKYLPASIIPPDGKEDRGKDDFVGVLKYNFEKVFDKVTFLAPLDVIHGTNAVVFHLKSDGISKSGKKYNNEYMVTFHFDGEKIIKLNEFVDSKYSSAYFGALRAEAAESSS